MMYDQTKLKAELAAMLSTLDETFYELSQIVRKIDQLNGAAHILRAMIDQPEPEEPSDE